MRLRPFLLALGLALGLGTAAAAQTEVAPPNPPPPVVMLVGVYHFANPGQDVVNIAADDVRTPARQAEIEALTARLAAFAPTIVAVEETSDNPEFSSRTYAEYLAGRRVDASNERDQLGFRLAKQVDARVVAVDVELPLPFGPLIRAGEATAPSVIGRVMADVQADAAAVQDVLLSRTISDALLVLNGPSALKRAADLYYIPLAISPDDGQTLPGVALATAWYERNLRICARLLSVAKPGQRLIAFYGSSHVPLLSQCLSGAGVRLEDPLPYLSAAR